MELILGTVLGIPVAWFFYWRSQRWSDHSLREHQRHLEAQQMERERIAEERHRELQRLLAERENARRRGVTGTSLPAPSARGVQGSAPRAFAANAQEVRVVSVATPTAKTVPTQVTQATASRPTPRTSPYADCPSCAEPSWNGLFCLSCGHTCDDLAREDSFASALVRRRVARLSTHGYSRTA